MTAMHHMMMHVTLAENTPGCLDERTYHFPPASPWKCARRPDGTSNQHQPASHDTAQFLAAAFKLANLKAY